MIDWWAVLVTVGLVGVFLFGALAVYLVASWWFDR